MKLRLRLQMPWHAVLLYATAAVISLGLLTTHLGSLAPRLSPSEQAALAASHSLRSIASDPLFAPMKLLLWLGHLAPGNFQILSARLVSVMLGLIALGAFIYTLHRWYGRRSVVFGFVLFATSAAYLHVARFAGFDIAYLTGMLALLAGHIAINDNEESAKAWFAWLVINTLLLFIPGMIWFVILSAVWQWRVIFHAAKSLNIWQVIGTITIPVLGIGAIAQSLIWNRSLAYTWLGIPSHLPVLRAFPHALLTTVMAIAYHGASRPELWLGGLPLLDLFTLFMVAAGLVFYGRHWRAARTHMLFGYVILGIILVSLGIVSISLLVPLLYTLAVGGIAYTLHFWLRRFPRNQIARYAGIIVIATITALSCYYNFVQYFVAWPHNPETVAVYQQKK